MTGFSQSVGVGLAFLVLAGCGSSQPPAAAPVAAQSPSAQERLNRLTERYWDEHIPVKSVISPQVLADSLAVERRYLGETAAISRDSLDTDSRLTYDIFKRRREILVEGFTYPRELLPLGALSGVLRSLELSSADSLRGAWSVADYEHWLKRVADYVGWTQQAMQNMREGVRRGYVSPRFLIERSAALLQHPSEDSPTSIFRAPLRSMPDSIAEPDRTRLKNLLANMVDAQLLPANRALRDYLQRDYLAHGRPGIAITDLPLGEKWYAYAIRRATNSTLGADEIHAIGVAEVERLHARLPVEHEASQPGAPSAEELLKSYEDLIAQVGTAMLPLFAELPNAALEVRGSEWLGDNELPLQFEPGGLLGKPAPVLYVNVAPAVLRTARVSIPSFMQEGLPGLDLQAAVVQERVELPRFRRMETDSGFVQGWGLYAASLAEQLGLLTDEASKADALAVQLRCTVGLVVDTGLHANGWTLKQALDYLHAQLVIDDAGAQALLDSYAANPGDALACKMGELKFASLRAKAQQVLGSRFDIRAFHAEILKDGAMPLDILETKMKLWMDAAR